MKKAYKKPEIQTVPLAMGENIASSGAGSTVVMIWRDGQLVLDESRGGCDNQTLLDWLRELLGGN